MSGTKANREIHGDVTAVIRGIFDAFQNHTPEAIESSFHPESTVWDVFVPRLFRGTAEGQRVDEEQSQSDRRSSPGSDRRV